MKKRYTSLVNITKLTGLVPAGQELLAGNDKV
jgi:hypothetical protein